MRKIAAIMLLLMMVTSVAFAEEETAPAKGTENVTVMEEQNEEGDSGTPDEQAEQTIDPNLVEMSLSETVFYKTGAEIKPVPALTYEGKPLSEDRYTLEYANNINAGTATVTAVFEGGSKSLDFEILPAKPQDAVITKVTSSKPKVIVNWRSVSCTGYELQVSDNNSFTSPATYRLTAVSKELWGLKNSRTYYFRVRAYITDNGKTSYSNWTVTSSKVSTTGEVGKKYSLNGVYVKNKTIKIKNNCYYYNSSGIKSGCSKKMWKKVRKASSKSKYLIAVDCSQNKVCVYKGKKGKWKLHKYWICTTGKRSTPTIKGSFKVKGKVSHFGEASGYSVWYATRIQYEYYFHSVLYKPYSKSSYRDSRLGRNLSHGCIRLSLKNAKWIYKKCKKGTRIIIY